MNYPNGMRKRVKKKPKSSTKIAYSNRGMSLEEDINVTNSYYLETNRAVIHKKPTPIQIVNVNYPKRSAAVITEAYFKQASTTDYNGIYQGKHIDFEAKETKNKTSFPLANIHEHQIRHMNAILKHGGISFFIIRFKEHDETYLYPGEKIVYFWEQQNNDGRKSVPYTSIQKDGVLIPFKYQARIDYLSVVDQLYF